jgi:fructokinase
MKKLLVFGEVLFDLFETQSEIGGAPFNVAAHFSALGGKADLVSAVGQDELGAKALLELQSRGVGSEHVKALPYPTGYCKVTLQNNTPSYELVREVAYDHIPACTPNAQEYGALYYGTLACRTEESLKTLEGLFPLCTERFYDVNIRPPFYSRALIRHLLSKATTLKISREEADVLCPCHTPEQYLNDVANEFANLKRILFTMDCDGSLLFDTATRTLTYAPQPKATPVSTVGAGDALSACYLYHTFKGSDIPTTLEACSALADHVITALGAVPALPEELKNRIV